MPAPETCPCCGSAKLSKLGEDITETLASGTRAGSRVFRASSAARIF
jgi:hypothetical protein